VKNVDPKLYKMEILNHLTGICGEQHLNIYDLTILLIIFILYLNKNKIKKNG